MYGQLIQLVLEMIFGTSLDATTENAARSYRGKLGQGELMATCQWAKRYWISLDSSHSARSSIYFGRPMDQAMPVLDCISVDP
jgi:hypothetical protein